MHTMNYRDLADTEYPAIRFALNEQHIELNDEQIENYIAEAMPGVYADDVENFMRSLQRFGRQVAPIAQRALPGIIQGAAQGGMVAGPWGALAGAIGGGAASLLSGGRQSPPSTSASARPQMSTQAPARSLNTLGNPAGRYTPGAVPSAGNAVNMAPIQQLLMLLSRPETMQALSALLMSASGRGAVSLGNRSVPAAAFANAISEIAADVADSVQVESSESLPEYLLDSTGQVRGDIVNPAERAKMLLEDICEVATQEFYEDEDQDDEDEDDEAYEEYLDEYFFEDDDDLQSDVLDDYEPALQGRSY